MLRIYEVVREMLRMLRPVIAQVETHDRDLARQMKKAGPSILLNVGEGSGNRGGTRRERYATALGSAKETTSCLHAALDLGYVESVDEKLLDHLDHIRAVLVKNVR